MKTAILFVLGSLAVIRPAAAADGCLAIVDYQATAPTQDYGFVEQQWEAQLENRCDAEFYAKVTLSFYDDDGEVLQESFTSMLVQGGKTVTVAKKAMFTEKVHQAVAETGIAVSGKEL